jgi:hypothetical protein
MTPSGYRFYRRRFLNREGFHTGAYVIATVKSGDHYGGIRITDCDRVIDLEFLVSNARELRNSTHKLDVLIEALTGFRAALVDAAAARKST